MLELTQLTSLLEKLKVAKTKMPMVWCENVSTLQFTINLVLHMLGF